MYPHIIIAFNIERHTMIGKLIIPGFEEDRYEHFFINNVTNVNDDDSDEEDDSLSTAYDAGKDYIDNILSGDILSVGTKWHNLPTFSETYELFKDKYNIKPRNRLSIRNIIKKYSDIFKIDI